MTEAIATGTPVHYTRGDGEQVAARIVGTNGVSSGSWTHPRKGAILYAVQSLESGKAWYLTDDMFTVDGK